jgi:hypothetical protein
MSFEKPENIKSAQESGDTVYLQAAGRKGAEATNAIKKRERERQEISDLQDEILAEKKAFEDGEQKRAANEHIITPDGVDLDFPK